MIKLLPIPHILMPMTSWGCSSLTSPKRPLKILFDYPRDVPICCLRDVPVWRPREVPNQPTRDFTWKTLSGCPPEDFQKTSYQLKLCGICNWMSPNLTLHFSPNLFDWSNLSKRNTRFRGIFRTQSHFYDGAFCEIT